MTDVSSSQTSNRRFPSWLWIVLLALPFVFAGIAAYLHDDMTSRDFKDLQSIKGQDLQQAYTEIELKEFSDPIRVTQLSTLTGPVTLLIFWASWCQPCLEEMPALQKLHLKYKDQGLKIIAINVEEDKTFYELQRFIDPKQIGYLQAQDIKKSAQTRYGVATLPSGYLIDSRGRIRLKTDQLVPWESRPAERLIEALLAEKNPS